MVHDYAALSHRWQGSATYSLSGLWNADTKPFSGLEQVTFATARFRALEVASERGMLFIALS